MFCTIFKNICSLSVPVPVLSSLVFPSTTALISNHYLSAWTWGRSESFGYFKSFLVRLILLLPTFLVAPATVQKPTDHCTSAFPFPLHLAHSAAVAYSQQFPEVIIPFKLASSRHNSQQQQRRSPRQIPGLTRTQLSFASIARRSYPFLTFIATLSANIKSDVLFFGPRAV